MDAGNQRCDEGGRAFAGSQLQVQLYVNHLPDELNPAVALAIPRLLQRVDRIRWVSPLEAARFAEYRDAAFLRAAGLEPFANALSIFWPDRGPCWDGLAVVEPAGIAQRAVILLEGKSYPREFYGSGIQASADVSIQKIKLALGVTKRWIGASGGADWTGRLYQSANRLAHLYFLREVCGIDAFLIHACFVDDPHAPTTAEQWDQFLPRVHAELGVAYPCPYEGNILLPARDRSELLR